jgi:hypothetical protein
VLKALPSDFLRAHVVFLPALRFSDKDSDALARASEFSDPRVHYYWDPGKKVSEALKDRLGIKGLVWDVYLLYDEDASWASAAPIPGFWMHQLRGAPAGQPFLNRDTLQVRAAAALMN